MVFQNGQGCPWFHAEASFLPKKLVVEKRTRKYAFQQPAGVIRSAPCIRYHYFQKRWKGAATSCCTQINPQRIRTDKDVRGYKQ